jgi:hypothetical protein
MVSLKSIRDIHRLIQNYAEERTQLLTKDVSTKPEQFEEIYTYLKALTNLYGVVPIDKVIEIYNAHHGQQIDPSDLRYIDHDKRIKEVTEFIELRKFFRNKYWNKRKADRLDLEIQILSKNIDAKDRMDNFFDRHRLKLSNNE